MVRTDDEAIRDIADFENIGPEEMATFIKDANRIVDARLKGHGASSAELEMIERWLTAHLAAMKEQRVQSESVGDVQKSYEGDHEQTGLKSTRYGQQAIAIDPTNRLEASSHFIKAVNTES